MIPVGLRLYAFQALVSVKVTYIFHRLSTLSLMQVALVKIENNPFCLKTCEMFLES